MGKNQLRLLRFAIRYPGWHTFGKDRSTVDAINSLRANQLLEVNWEFRQFRLYGIVDAKLSEEVEREPFRRDHPGEQ